MGIKYRGSAKYSTSTRMIISARFILVHTQAHQEILLKHKQDASIINLLAKFHLKVNQVNSINL